ncbi:VOC family protein [Pantoea dispersa]|uniref:VOC family protein n=1 Tax=Pantoea dispersa TaxID=59814 RepID=UPI001331B881|nr:VOC family protein [Pantoea dispersa]KAF0855976.1 prolyl endopeptidase [Pantoea dispersa 625]
MFTHMRIARPVTQLERSVLMFSQGLDLQKIAEFHDHDGFNGVMLGRKDLDWHLEFTCCPGHPVIPSPTEDDLLVLYYPDENAWKLACESMVEAGFKRTNSFNPYWDVNGQTFVDPDGYRVVMQNRAWG